MKDIIATYPNAFEKITKLPLSLFLTCSHIIPQTVPSIQISPSALQLEKNPAEVEIPKEIFNSWSR